MEQRIRQLEELEALAAIFEGGLVVDDPSVGEWVEQRARGCDAVEPQQAAEFILPEATLTVSLFVEVCPRVEIDAISVKEAPRCRPLVGGTLVLSPSRSVPPIWAYTLLSTILYILHPAFQCARPADPAGPAVLHCLAYIRRHQLWPEGGASCS